MTKRVTVVSLLSGCSLLLAAGLSATPAQAGFEWVPAQEAPQAMQKPQEVIIPEPVIKEPSIDGQPVSQMKHIVVTDSAEGEVDAMPVTEEVEVVEMGAEEDMTASVEQDSAIEAETEVEIVEEDVAVLEAEEDVVEKVVYEETMPQKEYGLAYGFGKDMPLALALRQIVPSSYAFSFDPDVNIGSRVSWQGGEPWNVVLNQALMKEDLQAIVYDDMVFVRPLAVEYSHDAVAPVVEAEASEEPAPLAPVEDDKPAYFDDAHSWAARSGQTLRSVLSDWSDQVGVELHWENVYDYAITADWSYDGNYVHAVDGLLTAFEAETPKPEGSLHPNAPEGPAVLVVSVKE